VDIALGEEQVVPVVGGDLDDPGAVTSDRHRAVEAADRDRAARLRPAALGRDRAHDEDGNQRQDQQDHDPFDHPPRHAPGPSHDSDPS